MLPIFSIQPQRGRRPSVAAALRVEQLEPREVPAAPAAAQFNAATDLQPLSSFTTLPLRNTTTADFTATGSLFVQTTKGVATVQYTGKTDSSFTGVSVVGGDATGLLQNDHPAVYQATSATFRFDFTEATGLGQGTVPTNEVYFAMFWSSTGELPGGATEVPSFYYWKSGDAGGATGAYAPVGDLGAGKNLPTYQLAFDPTSHKATVELPYVPANSARFVLGVGSPPAVPVVKNDDGNLGVAPPVPEGSDFYFDFVEFTLDANAVDNNFPGVRPLAQLNVNLSQVDGYGLPLTLTGNANVGGKNVVSSVGLPPDSPGITRAAIVSGFPVFLAGNASGAAYRDLLLPGVGGGPPRSIESPGLYLSNHPAAPLRNAFDAALVSLFETGTTPLSLQFGNPAVTYTGTRAKATVNGTDNQPHEYSVLRFTDPAGHAFNVFLPLFSTNGHPDRPPAPSWFTATQAAESAGAMVFGNDGVFADAGRQDAAGQLPAVDNAVGILGNLENQLVVALNRGVALKYATTADWQDPAHYYPAGEPANLYAAFLHSYQIGGKDIFIDRKAYALAYDDQAGQNPSLVLLAQDELSTTLGGWISPQTAVPAVLVGAGAGGGPRVSVFDARSGSPALSFFAFEPAVTTGVRVAAGDVNGDGVRDLIAAAAPDGGPRVRVLDGATGKQLASFFAFEESFAGGVYVAAGDLDGDGKAEVVVSAGPGGGPRVAVFDGTTGAQKFTFLAYEEAFRGGATVAVGDVNGDGKPEIVTGAGPNGGPRVRAFDGATGADTGVSFFAFAESYTGGVFVAAGNVDGDGGGRAEVVVSAGPGGGAEVRAFDGPTGASKGKVTVPGAVPPGGLRAGAGDVDGDGRAEVLVAAGKGSEPRVWVYDLSKPDPVYTFLAFEPAFTGGVWIDA